MRNLRPFIIALVAAACSGSNATSYGGGGGGTPPPSGSVTAVTIQDNLFSPSSVSIRAGTTVKWTNNGASAHTTTSDNGVWNSGTLGAPSGGGWYGGESAGGTYQVTFTTPGTYSYHCAIHPPSSFPGFVGTITVTQ